MKTGRIVLTGEYFMSGDFACAEGAIAAGCRFFAGYPITPASEIAERMSERLPEVEGVFIQMEDELASMAALVGASWAGAKPMTSTSGPGFSLMQENIGLAAMMEAPCVIVDVQRGGPSTGLPTTMGQGDVMQSRWGSHGDYEIIALSPSSPQEIFDLTIKAFNLAEIYRVPVIVLTDEVVGHMTEKVVIPKASEITVVNRKRPSGLIEDYRPYRVTDDDLVPAMVSAGDGYGIHATGLTHDEKGYPDVSPEMQEELIPRLVNKIRLNAGKIAEYEEREIDDAEVVIVSYGISARTSLGGLQLARKRGLKVGFMKLITVWPFPEKRIRELSEKVKAFVVPEINLGQIALEVERCAGGKAEVVLVSRAGGAVHTPEEIVEAISGVIQ